jgi:hypothetical protein
VIVPAPATGSETTSHQWLSKSPLASKLSLETTDPITGDDVTDLEHATYVIDGELKIYFESEASRREYEAIGVEHPGTDFEHNLGRHGPGRFEFQGILSTSTARRLSQADSYRQALQGFHREAGELRLCTAFRRRYPGQASYCVFGSR